MNSSIGLAGGIIRDSQDPGASDVITAGGWLPTPKPMNGLFRDYEGLVLMAQRAFDPSARQKCDFRYKCHVCCFLRSWQAKSPLLQTHISEQKSQNKIENWPEKKLKIRDIYVETGDFWAEMGSVDKFEIIPQGVTVDLMRWGHCLLTEENPKMVSGLY